MAIKYIPYFPSTLEGQAVLDNFVRTKRVLRYRDNDRVIERVARGMPLYEMELKEQVGQNPNNLVIRGECLSACAYLKDRGIQVDLVYIDPPFASGADYAKKVYVRRNPKVAQAIAQAQAELDVEDMKAFEEKMYGDVWDKERYLNWMYENLMAIKAVMSDEASIYVHLDYHIGHYVKILLDEIFGESNFRNEIIWKRSLPHNDPHRYGSIHDTIYYYVRGEDFVFNQMNTGLSDDYIKSHYNMIDENGRRYQLTSLSATGPGEARRFGDKILLPPAGNHWRYSQENIDKLMSEGLIVFTSTGRPRFKRYLDTMSGPALQSIWSDVLPINSQALEALDYATQKPEALLERIIKASSDKGMVVADFFGGSGVTAAVANKLGRGFIHCDIGINSILTARDRLLADNAEFNVMEIKDGVSLFRNPVQTMEKLKSLIPGLRDEPGLDRLWAGSIVDTRHGMMPVYLPNLLDSGCRVLDKPMMNRIIREALPDLPDETRRVIVYYIDITGVQEIRDFISEQNDRTTIDIELRDLKQVLDEVVVEDVAQWQVSETHDEVFPCWRVEVTSFHSDRVRRKIDEVNNRGQQQALQQRAKGKAKTFTPIVISEHGLETIEWVSLDCTTADKQAPWHSDTEVKIDRLGRVIIDGKKTQDLWDAAIICRDKPLRMKIRNICGDETIFVL